METILEINQLTKQYNHQKSLNNVSMKIKKGEIYGLIGRNGAGKTTLLKVITRLIEPTKGNVSLFGSTNNSEWTKSLSRIGAIIENPVANDQLTAYQNLMYYCKLRGIVNAPRVIKETLELVDLADTGDKKFKNFSLGMKQKLGIAIAILPNPDFLILDEPLNGLDPVAIIDFRKLIKRLNEEREMTIIISSHILSELYHVATCFGIIDNGQFIKEISRIDFDQLSQDYIVLQTNQVNLASQVIKEYMHQPMKVVDQNEIHIFGLSSDVKEIAPILVQEGIKIDGIYYAKQDLENYFANLINLDKEKNHD